MDHVLVGPPLCYEWKCTNIFPRFPLGKTFGLHGSKYSFSDIVKHSCSCCCHSASRTFSCLQGTQYPLLLVFSLMFAPLCWVCSSKCCDTCYVDNSIGFVHVGLLYNTFRVISPVYNRPRSAKAVTKTAKTFGNDVFGESPIVPRHEFFSQSTIPTYEISHQTYSPAQPSSNHTRDQSWSSENSNTELLGGEKALYESIQTKGGPLPLNGITSPARLSRQLGGNPGIISPQGNTKGQDINFQSEEMVDVPLRTASPDSRSPRVSFVTGDSRHEPSAQDQQWSFRPMADTDAPTKGGKQPSFKSKAPAPLNLSRFPGLPVPLSSGEVSNKSTTLAARLGIPVASAYNPSQTSTVSSAQKLDQGNAKVSVFPPTPIPWITINISSPENANASNSRVSVPPPSPASTGTDGDLDYSGEVVHVRKVRQLPEVPEPGHNEQGIADACPRSMRAQSQRTTMSSVWSQETGYTMSRPPDAVSQAYQQLVANALVPGVKLGERASVGGATQSQRTTMSSVWSQETGYTMTQPPDAERQNAYQQLVANALAPGVMRKQSGPRGRPKMLHAIKVASKLSARFPDMLSPKSPNNMPRIVPAPNDSVV